MDFGERWGDGRRGPYGRFGVQKPRSREGAKTDAKKKILRQGRQEAKSATGIKMRRDSLFGTVPLDKDFSYPEPREIT
jgi:hypothetical protein